jgi:LuxR family maltose regulon positive regulatory protein
MAWKKAKGKRQKENNAPGEAFLPFPFDLLPFEVAWVSLDTADSDPLRFWSYVIAALDLLQPDSGAAALALLQSPQPPPIEAVLTPLLNALSTLPTDAVLILDDYHLIDAPPIHSALAFLLDRLPPQLHLVLTTRADPPLPLTRLRARGQLTELRADDLRFTADETAAFLTELMGLPLSADDVAVLEARTEGWIAGLQLAAVAAREHAHPAQYIQAFTGDHRFIIDYLVDEVLERQPAHIKSFLLHTAILDQLCGPLCDAVMGLTPDERHAEVSESVPNTDHHLSSFVLRPSSGSYSQLILEQLEHANLFLTALDDARHWYRYHPLFAEVLRSRLIGGARDRNCRPPSARERVAGTARPARRCDPPSAGGAERQCRDPAD